MHSYVKIFTLTSQYYTEQSKKYIFILWWFFFLYCTHWKMSRLQKVYVKILTIFVMFFYLFCMFFCLVKILTCFCGDRTDQQAISKRSQPSPQRTVTWGFHIHIYMSNLVQYKHCKHQKIHYNRFSCSDYERRTQRMAQANKRKSMDVFVRILKRL